MASHEGVVGMIDALGIRGVWRSADPEELLNYMAETANVALQSCPVGVQLRFLSDTVVFFSESAEPDRDTRLLVEVKMIADAISVFLGIMLNPPGPNSTTTAVAPINYRGVLTFGKYHYRENFMMGPAVDDAASLYETADAAICFLSPTLEKQFRDALLKVERPPVELEDLLVRTKVPLKGGGLLQTRAVNPLRSVQRKHRPEAIDASLEAFSRGPSLAIDVAIKQQNTREFYERINSR